MTITNKLVIAALALLSAVTLSAEEHVTFVDHSTDTTLVETRAYLLVGGSYLSNNYTGCFPSIRQSNTTMGVIYGAGVGVTLNVKNYLGFGTEANITVNHGSMNVFTFNNDVASASNLYMSNTYTYFNIPVYASWRFNVASTVRWIVDTGFYYSYGIGGHQSQTLYRTLVNDLGQVVYEIETFKPDFFKSPDTFQNSFGRSDIGLHLASSLVFKSHFLLGARTQIGFRNIAYVPNGIKIPNVHNISFLVNAGWVF